MIIEFFDFVNVQEKARALGCNIPTGVAVLPYNFEKAATKEELAYEPTAVTVRTLLRRIGIVETPLERKGEKFPERPKQYYDDWRGPIIFTSLAAVDDREAFLFTQMWWEIAAYLRCSFLGKPPGTKAILDAVVERQNKIYRCLHYEGPVFHLNDFSKAAHELIQMTLPRKSFAPSAPSSQP